MHGRPRWSKEYGRVLVLDEEFFYFFAALLLLLTRPFFLGIVPTCTRSVLALCKALKRILSVYAPSLASRAMDQLNRVTSKTVDIIRFNASIEMMTGFVLLLQLFTGYQVFVSVLMYWQYLRFRYMMSNNSKMAFASLRTTLEQYLLHPKCPSIIQFIYTKFKSALESLVNPHQQSMMSSGVMMAMMVLMMFSVRSG